ncbi:hypothetical protein GCM10023187_41350 [Nibrella viscosa]|uniref:Uncharacterized protein n=1 Tax=Nibrella viscosa TaxID=1084524 RepID=A0ABP8KQE7_9BACT
MQLKFKSCFFIILKKNLLLTKILNLIFGETLVFPNYAYKFEATNDIVENNYV